ncbi:MAG: L,D-transpeptidase family protein [Planctomycetes bacterium]|nr:L,D-transpeptidase family protein [Planctomycetota bacterium]
MPISRYGDGQMARRRRRARYRGTLTTFLLLGTVALSWWWLYARGRPLPPLDTSLALGTQPAPDDAATRSVAPSSPAPPAPQTEDRPVERPEETLPPKAAAPPPPSTPGGDGVAQAIAAARQASQSGDLLTARARYAEAWNMTPGPGEAEAIRAELSRIGQETIFSPRVVDGDPLVERYVIQTGDSLAQIAAKYRLTADLLASVNNIADKHRIRAGQTIKVVRGPFRAMVDKGEFTLDLYLGDTFVRSYRVGLGADDSTPTGEWQVGTKLVNPTYYPPRGGEILSADNPRNPLGERWIGLVGTGGEAVGQGRYGVHGTIGPESVGRNASMGCIRLRNEDVEQLYVCLVEKHSTVTIR